MKNAINIILSNYTNDERDERKKPTQSRKRLGENGVSVVCACIRNYKQSNCNRWRKQTNATEIINYRHLYFTSWLAINCARSVYSARSHNSVLLLKFNKKKQQAKKIFRRRRRTTGVRSHSTPVCCRNRESIINTWSHRVSYGVEYCCWQTRHQWKSTKSKQAMCFVQAQRSVHRHKQTTSKRCLWWWKSLLLWVFNDFSMQFVCLLNN